MENDFKAPKTPNWNSHQASGDDCEEDECEKRKNIKLSENEDCCCPWPSVAAEAAASMHNTREKKNEKSFLFADFNPLGHVGWYPIVWRWRTLSFPSFTVVKSNYENDTCCTNCFQIAVRKS